MNIFIVIVCILSFFTNESESNSFIQWQYHEIPRPPPPKLNPAEIMVDITNNLAYRLMDLHSICNRNNFAFSPTALTSVLIALYEGSSGKSSDELRAFLDLPFDRNVVRIGYRDIHRRLRTYFFEQDNPLNGLSLNKENVTITPEYEAILKFYGYDLGSDMVSSTPSSIKPISADNSTEKPPESTTLSPESTTITEINTTDANQSRNSTETTTIEPKTSTESKLEETTSTEIPTTTSTTEIPTTTTTTEMPEQTTQTNAVEELETTTEDIQRTTIYIQKFKPVTTTATPIKTSEKLKSSRQTVMRTGKIGQWGTMPGSAVFRQNRSRNKRHFFNPIFNQGLGFKGPYNSGFSPNVQNNYIPQPNYFAGPNVQSEVYFAFVPLEESVPLVPPSFPNTNVEENKSYGVPKETSKSDIINHIFYLTPHETIQSTYKTYNSILLYKYLEELRLTVLELELDTKDYSLIVLLPDFNNDIESAIASLKYTPTLRILRQQLKPRWVQAIIPDFKLKGNVYLTNDILNMGITELFEPSRAEFGPMSDENGIYVKHIEQSININIRTRSIDQIKRNVGNQNRPIEVAVNHPFIFFIIDKELDIALMAGRVLNPLNVRIQ